MILEPKLERAKGKEMLGFVAVGSKKLSVVWIGNDENKPIGLTGASGALPVFRRFSKNTKTTATF